MIASMNSFDASDLNGFFASGKNARSNLPTAVVACGLPIKWPTDASSDYANTWLNFTSPGSADYTFWSKTGSVAATMWSIIPYGTGYIVSGDRADSWSGSTGSTWASVWRLDYDGSVVWHADTGGPCALQVTSGGKILAYSNVPRTTYDNSTGKPIAKAFILSGSSGNIDSAGGYFDAETPIEANPHALLMYKILSNSSGYFRVVDASDLSSIATYSFAPESGSNRLVLSYCKRDDNSNLVFWLTSWPNHYDMDLAATYSGVLWKVTFDASGLTYLDSTLLSEIADGVTITETSAQIPVGSDFLEITRTYHNAAQFTKRNFADASIAWSHQFNEPVMAYFHPYHCSRSISDTRRRFATFYDNWTDAGRYGTYYNMLELNPSTGDVLNTYAVINADGTAPDLYGVA